MSSGCFNLARASLSQFPWLFRAPRAINEPCHTIVAVLSLSNIRTKHVALPPSPPQTGAQSSSIAPHPLLRPSPRHRRRGPGARRALRRLRRRMSRERPSARPSRRGSRGSRPRPPPTPPSTPAAAAAGARRTRCAPHPRAPTRGSRSARTATTACSGCRPRLRAAPRIRPRRSSP